jgi:membrane-associated protease RseP (regulator of RpoE activity)
MMIEASKSSATMEQADDLRNDVADLYTTESVTLDRPETGHIRFHGRFIVDLSARYDDLRRRFERHGFTPFVRDEDGRESLIAVPVVFTPSASNVLINIILLVATILSTLFIGASMEFGIRDIDGVFGLGDLWLGWPYSASLLTILGAHELGHYFAARYHKVPVTLPYFIPLPFPPIGTLGAFIRLKSPIKNKRVLLDVGAAGPLAGLIFAIPILLYGLSISPVEPLPAGGYILEGNSILYGLAKIAVKGQMLPNGTDDVFLGQIAWAGWVGLLVTGLNLIPVCQLDGGHIAYSLWGKRARLLFWPVIVALIALVIFTRSLNWGIWILLLFFVGRYHAEPFDDVTPLDGRRRVIAITSLILFILVFVPIPLRQVMS